MKLLDKLYASTEKHRPITSGFYAYHTPHGVQPQYRLHLRIEPDGEGVLIVNASTVLHLNQTATEMVYNLIQGVSDSENAKLISKRFMVDKVASFEDVSTLHHQLDELLNTTDLNPEAMLPFETHTNFENISAPYRLDCYLREPAESSQPTLSLEVWKSILHKAYSAGIPHILFCGNEPTEVAWLPDLLAYAEELGLVTGLVSRGAKLTDNSYLTTLINAGLDHLMVVFDPIDGRIREALSCVLPLDLYTSVGLIVRSDIDHRPLIDWLDGLGANAYCLIAHDEESIPSLHILAEDLALREHRLVDDMPFPSEDRRSSGNIAESVEGHRYINLSVSPTGDVFDDNTWSERLGSMLHDSFATIWSNRRPLV